MVTRSIREMIDFLMSILSTPFVSTPINHQTSLIYCNGRFGGAN